MKKVSDIFPPGEVPKVVGKRRAKSRFSKGLGSLFKKAGIFLGVALIAAIAHLCLVKEIVRPPYP